MEQLALPIAAACKNGCAAPVAGNSITGLGHVCRRCNVIEWGESLATSRDPYYRALGDRLLADTGSRPRAALS